MKIIPTAIIAALLCPISLWAQAEAQPSAPAQNPSPASPPAQTAPQSGSAPADAKPEAATASTPAANQPIDTLPRKYVEYWNTGNVDVLNSFFSPFFITSHGHRVPVGRDMMRRVVDAWRRSMPDLNFKIADTIIEGDKVAMRLTFTGTYKRVLFAMTVAPAPGGPPKVIHGTEMLFFQLKDGKIVDIWEEYDELVMRAQMGGIWSTPKAAEATSSQETPEATPPNPQSAPPSSEAAPPTPKP